MLLQHSYLAKTVVVMLPQMGGESPMTSSLHWQFALEEVAPIGLRLPAFRPGGALVHLGEAGSDPVAVPLPAWDGDGVRAALQQLLPMVGEQPGR